MELHIYDENSNNYEFAFDDELNGEYTSEINEDLESYSEIQSTQDWNNIGIYNIDYLGIPIDNLIEWEK